MKARAESIAGRVVCIEAHWDGDTTGWFINMFAVVSNGVDETQHLLAYISHGGDLRLFNGEVPPWPEAVHASTVGAQLAEHFSVEFYFPSLCEPNDRCPSWLESKR
jgi:hypothetical protein